MKKPANEPAQVSLNEAIAEATGEPTPANVVPIATPKRTRSKPGTHNVFVTVSDEFYAKLEKSADGRPVNVWLSRLVERTTFPELEGEKKIGE